MKLGAWLRARLPPVGNRTATPSAPEAESRESQSSPHDFDRPEWAKGIGDPREALDILRARSERILADWKKISEDPQTRQKFEELFGRGQHYSRLTHKAMIKTYKWLPTNVKAAVLGGTAGSIGGTLLGGGSIGIVAFGTGIGIPIIAIAAAAGAILGERLGREQILDLDQKSRAAERQLTAFKKVEERSPAVELIRGPDHWNILQWSLYNARQRLCIRSAFIAANVVDARFIEQIESALERGVHIIVEYGEEWNLPVPVFRTRSRAAAIERLDLLAERAKSRRLAGRLEHGATNTHVKELAVDQNYVVIGSYNWLSNRRGDRGESSIRVSDTGFCNEVFEDACTSLANLKVK